MPLIHLVFSCELGSHGERITNPSHVEENHCGAKETECNQSILKPHFTCASIREIPTHVGNGYRNTRQKRLPKQHRNEVDVNSVGVLPHVRRRVKCLRRLFIWLIHRLSPCPCSRSKTQ